MRRLALIAVLLVPLAAAPPAAAKEVHSVTACGAGECVTSTEGGLLVAMRDIGPPSDPPAGAAPFYRLTIAIGDGRQVFERWHMRWVPSAERLIGEDGTWTAVNPVAGAGLAKLTSGLEAVPAKRLPGMPRGEAEPASAPPAPASDSGDSLLLPVLAIVTALALAGGLAARELLAREGFLDGP